MGFKIGSIVDVRDAVMGETLVSPTDKSTYETPICTVPRSATAQMSVKVKELSKNQKGMITSY